MKACRLSLFVLALVAAPFALARSEDQPATAAAPASVKVSLDTTGAPDLAPWAEEAKALVEKWYPVLSDRLKSEGFTPPTDVTLIFKDKEGVAETSGRVITISSRWVKAHPDDTGMVIHEVVHVIQSYPPSRAGWLVEGIADYIRFFLYEPQTKVTIHNPDKASYRDSYRTTGKFLDWVERQHEGTVNKLNAALRQGRFKASLFEEYTGKNLDDLWADFIKDVKKDQSH